MASKYCEELLPGLDEDIAEYISGILDDDGALDPDSVDDTTEMIAGLLGEYCEETDERIRQGSCLDCSSHTAKWRREISQYGCKG